MNEGISRITLKNRNLLAVFILVLFAIIIFILFSLITSMRPPVNEDDQLGDKAESIVLDPVVSKTTIRTEMVEVKLPKNFEITTIGTNLVTDASCLTECKIFLIKKVDENKPYYLTTPVVLNFEENISELKKTKEISVAKNKIVLTAAIAYLFSEEDIEKDLSETEQFITLQSTGCYLDICFSSGLLNLDYKTNSKEIKDFESFLKALTLNSL